jgi:hypothetical protein
LLSVPVELVPLQAGNYQVDVYRRQLFNPSQVDLMVSGSLTVLPAQGQGSAHPIPASGYWSMVLMGLLLGWFGWLRWRS